MKPRVLDDAEISKLKESELVRNRVLQRDIHYTLEERSFDGTLTGPVVETHTGSSITFNHNTYLISDRKFIYFFPEWWPSDHADFLRDEDVIASGLGSLNCSTDNKQKVLEQLMRENARIPAVACQKKADGQLDLSTATPTDTPINSMDALDFAIYHLDSHVVKLLGTVDIPFNKPLFRVPVKGGSVERYNSKAEKWEKTSEKYTPPSFAERVKARFFG